MREGFFTVKEAAEILGCSRRSVERLLANGWLKRPAGWAKMGGTARVGEKSVFQLLIFDRLSLLPSKTLKDFKNGRKNFTRFLRQNTSASCLSSSERTGGTPQDSQPISQDNSGQPKRCLHHDFAAEHQFSFGWIARQLLPNDDFALQDDLVQEMSLAVLEHKEPASCEYLLQIAENRAKNYLKYEERRGMLSLEKACEEPDSIEAKMESLRNLIEALIERGVPREWIDEVIGGRQSDWKLADAG